MKKKGFTLIELLAVIVILAIIALIATPLVLKYIEKSRKESKVDSAYSFVRNLETEIANYSIKHNGKKYNGQPTDKGYYELDSFNGSEIDTTVKGDKPNSIKVCLSSLGQVDKGVFQYDKYYVSYDGKKGSISDEATFNSFSCSRKETQKNPVFKEENKTFTYNSDTQGYMISGTFNSNELVIPELYDLVIDGNVVTQLLGFYQDENLMFVNEANDTMVTVSGDSAIVHIFYELAGTHNVEIVKSNDNFNLRTIVRITEDDKLFVLSADIVSDSSVNVSILDQNNNELYNGTHSIDEQGSINGLVEYDLSDVYSKLSTTSEVTITVTQTYNNEEKIIYNIKDIPNNKSGSVWTNNANYYYLGNDIIPFIFT